MVVGFTTICAISAYHHYYVVSLNPTDGEVYSIQHYVIKFVLVFSWYSGFLHQLNWPPQYNWNIVEGVSNTITLTLTLTKLICKLLNSEQSTHRSYIALERFTGDKYKGTTTYHILVIGLDETTNISSLFGVLCKFKKVLAASRWSYDSVASEINMNVCYSGICAIWHLSFPTSCDIR